MSIMIWKECLKSEQKNKHHTLRRVFASLGAVLLLLSGCIANAPEYSSSSELSHTASSASDISSTGDVMEGQLITFNKNSSAFKDEAYYQTQKIYVVLNGTEHKVNALVPCFMMTKSLDRGEYFNEVLVTILDCGLETLPYTVKPNGDERISEAVLFSVRHANPEDMKQGVGLLEQMRKYAASDSYIGPSDVGYLDRKLVQSFIAGRFSETMQEDIEDSLAYYFCEPESLYSIPWHTIEVQLLTVVFSYEETPAGCEIVFSSVGFMSAGEKMLYYPGEDDTLVIGNFVLSENAEGNYEANPGIYTEQIDKLNRVRVKLIKSEQGLLIDEVSADI